MSVTTSEFEISMACNGALVMSVFITTQADMQRARKAIGFCYLCGSSLVAVGKPAQAINDEHVIPKALFSTAPAVDAWRPILPVHVKCHSDIKNDGGDETAALLHKTQLLQGTLEDRGFVGNLKRLGLELRSEIDPESGLELHMIKGFSQVYDAVWNWVRGLHATIYGEFLPSLMKHHVYAPHGEGYVPELDTNGRKRISPREFRRRKQRIENVLAHVFERGNFDGLRCWNREFQYICTWAQPNRRGLHQCIWGLFYPEATQYAAGAPYSGSPGWMGMYRCVKAPSNRALATS